MQEDAEAPATEIMGMLTSRNARRRSSISIAQPAPSDASSAAAAAAALSSMIMAGDKSSRPHFLKERPATMRGRMSVPSPAPAYHGAQSKASAFLLGLVERSHSSPSHFEPKATPAQPPVPEVAPRSATQRRSGTMIEPMEPPPHDPATGRRKSILRADSSSSMMGLLQPQNSSCSLLSAQQALTRVRSGLSSLDSHNEDEGEYVSEAELRAKPLKDLVRDLGLYAKKQATLLRILNEIHRRLQDAEMDVGHGPTHVPMCREIVDEGVLKLVVQAMREFRFDVSLQMAAISLLSFLADVSDLYAFLMAELDVEPLVQKVVGDHVSQERLVMNGSTLFHAISESKRKSDVVKEHKARQAEVERRKRTESFIQVFATGLNSSKPKNKLAVEDRRLNDLHRPGSRWQRHTLSARLGAPPLLTAHYDLEVTRTARRPSEIPPLENVPSSSEEYEGDPLRLDDAFLSMRPVTSPEPHASTLTSRFRSLTSPSSAHVAAIYSKSPMFVAPSPLAERMSVRRTQSATALKRQSTKRRGHTPVSRPRQLPPQEITQRTTLGEEQLVQSQRSDDGITQNDIHEGDEGEEQEEEEEEDTPSQENNKGDGSQREEGPEEDDEDPTYDDDFVEDADQEDDTAKDSELQHAQGRLLPVGSDSELLELVENPEQSEVLHQDNESPRDTTTPVPKQGLVAMNSDSELLAMIEKCSSEASSTDLKIEDDPVTTELVGLLSSCVDSNNPTTRPSPGPDSDSRQTPPTSKPKKKKKPAPCSPSVSAWVPPTTIVRPVSKRIMDKTSKITKQTARAPRLSSRTGPRPSSGVTTMQITSILDKIIPNDDPADETAPEEDAESHTIGFMHVPEPCTTPTTSISQIQALYARGLQHHKADELDAAIRCYEAGIKLQHSSGVDREFASLYINLGSAKMTQHKLSDALGAFLHAERIQPQNTKAIFNCGLVLMQLEQWSDAKAKLERVVAMDSSHVRAKVALEQCELAMRR